MTVFTGQNQKDTTDNDNKRNMSETENDPMINDNGQGLNKENHLSSSGKQSAVYSLLNPTAASSPEDISIIEESAETIEPDPKRGRFVS